MHVVDRTAGQDLPDEETLSEAADSGKNPAAVALGRLGGLRGGKARWKGTTKKERIRDNRQGGAREAAEDQAKEKNQPEVLTLFSTLVR